MKDEYDFSKGKRGAVVPQKGKTRISIFIDNAILAEFRARAEKAGTGYQTMMNDALRAHLSQVDQPPMAAQCLKEATRTLVSRRTFAGIFPPDPVGPVLQGIAQFGASRRQLELL